MSSTASSANRVRLHVEDSGGEGRPVVLIWRVGPGTAGRRAGFAASATVICGGC